MQQMRKYEVVSEAIEGNEWNEMRAGVDQEMFFLFGLGKVQNMCIIEATMMYLMCRESEV